MIDVDRLHQTYKIITSGAQRTRQMGATFAYIDMLLAEAELGDDHNLYLYVGYNRNIANVVREQFLCGVIERELEMPELDWMERMGRSHLGLSHLVDVQNKSFIFTYPAALAGANCLAGLAINRAFFDLDMSEITNDHVLNLHVTKSIMLMKRSLIICNGDVI